MTTISYDHFSLVDMRVGTIRFAEPVEGTDKLLRCLVDFGPDLATDTYTDESGTEFPVRQIISGIKQYFEDYTTIIGRQALYCVNLEPREIKGFTSHGMLMAIGDDQTAFSFMCPELPVHPGSKIR